LISPRIDEEDKIEIVFKEGGLLKSFGGDREVPENYSIISTIPR